jgi:catechol 2,3-dioxygenase-like lactoylglutathione lyase family enzyme
MQHTTLPGTARLDHTGHVVPDLDAALAFFTDVLGCTIVSRHGPLADEGDAMARIYGAHPRAAVRFAFVELHGRRIELTEWQAPDQQAFAPRACDVGGSHIAVGVTDLAAAMDFLRSQPGVTLFEESPRGFVYFTAPWGMLLQLVEAAP